MSRKRAELRLSVTRKTRQGKARQGKARQGKARQGKARQGKAMGVGCKAETKVG